MVAIHGGDQAELPSLQLGIDAAVLNVLDRRLRGADRGIADRRPLTIRRQKRGTPIVDTAVSQRRADRDEGRRFSFSVPKP